MSPMRIFVGVKDDGGGGDNWSYDEKAPFKSSVVTTNKRTPSFYMPDALPVTHPTNSVRALEGKITASMRLPVKYCSS